jgi:hypothetical protein
MANAAQSAKQKMIVIERESRTATEIYSVNEKRYGKGD